MEKHTISLKKITAKTEFFLVNWIYDKSFTVLDSKFFDSKERPKIESIQKIKYDNKILDAQVKFIGSKLDCTNLEKALSSSIIQPNIPILNSASISETKSQKRVQELEQEIETLKAKFSEESIKSVQKDEEIKCLEDKIKKQEETINSLKSTLGTKIILYKFYINDLFIGNFFFAPEYYLIIHRLIKNN